MTIRQIAAAGLLASLFALGTALASQHFLSLVPCALCYVERWPYRAGIAVGLLGLVLPLRAARPVTWLMPLVFLAAAASATVHVGVEQHWWTSPLPECTAPDLSGLTSAERFARMPDRPTKSCEDVDYLIPAIPVTMAQANLLFALASCAGISILLGMQSRKRA